MNVLFQIVHCDAIKVCSQDYLVRCNSRFIDVGGNEANNFERFVSQSVSKIIWDDPWQGDENFPGRQCDL